MLGAEAHTERLAFQLQAAVHQHPEGIAGRVAHREHQSFAGKGAICGKNAGDLTIFLFKAGQGRVEMHLTAQSFDLLADRGDHTAQQVGAHVGLLLPGDLLRRTVLQEHLGNKTAQLIADAGGQLAVRESTGTALAKLNVRIHIQFAGSRKMFHRLYALVQRRAALQHNGLIALPGQQQRCKQARRAKAAHHRPVRQRKRAILHRKIHLFLQRCIAAAGSKRCFFGRLFQGDSHRVHQLGLAMAGIHRELCYAQMLRLSARDAGSVQGFFKCLRLSGRERQTDVANQNHVIVCSFLFQLLSMRHCST